MRYISHFLFALLLAAAFYACSNDSARNADTTSTEPAPGEDIITMISDEIIANPNNPNLYINRALAYGDRSMYDLAHRDIARAMSIDSTVSEFHAAKGELFFKSAELRLARLSLERAAELDAKNTEALLKLGEVNFLLRRYPEAISSVDAALGVNQRLPKAYFLKGFIFKELGDTTRALSSFQTATEVNPDYFEAYMELGNLYVARQDPLALEYFNSAIDIRPASSEAYYHKAMFLQNGGSIDEAMVVYHTMIKADPKSFLGFYNLGYLHLVELGEYEIASAYFDTVLSIQPEYIDALFNKGVCYEEMGDEKTAVAIYREVLEKSPDYTLASMGLGRLLEK
jgi:tetratricopeptide (TPR) repeat protein